ncbi:flagellar protein FlaG [Paenibacillus sp. SC116]|uniref:flagellar protein FlaG n=1 Tax=Paenibacillus sp. SC116 TaxID=2968986 RepID=UPI00215AD8CB|nr:flagellar protein FlaG [Paenibacillus sp. SC116]MCR8844805.1 flagellar protein FlaG [Paenibacillus sp. SC116]
MRIDSVQPVLSMFSSGNPEMTSREAGMTAELESAEIKKKYTVEELVNKFNTAMQDSQTHIKVKMHEDMNAIMVTIIDSNTDEVIKEIPSEKMLDMMYNLCVKNGLFMDEKV